MAAEFSLTRRSALASLGAGSLGLFARSSAALPMDARGSSGGGILSTSTHPLAGRWLSKLGLPSQPDIVITVPSFFGADGTVVMVFPSMQAGKHGVEVRGAALGDWEPTSVDTGHFTAVQVLANIDGEYIGTVTIDGYAQLDPTGNQFSVRNADHLFILRNRFDLIIEHGAASSTHPMRGTRMRAGDAGFRTHMAPTAASEDARTPE